MQIVSLKRQFAWNVKAYSEKNKKNSAKYRLQKYLTQRAKR